MTKKAIKKGAVTKKALKKGAVTAKALKAGAVGNGALADGSVDAAKLADVEAPHTVGGEGGPPFSNGGDGDCLWVDASELIPGVAPVQFYKDPLGRVHLSGAAEQNNAAGGDGDCGAGGSVNDNNVDQSIFILPPSYRPAQAQIGQIPGATGNYIVTGDTPLPTAPLPSLPVPAGAVAFSTDVGDVAFLDGISWQAATPGSRRAAARSAEVDPDKLSPELARTFGL